MSRAEIYIELKLLADGHVTPYVAETRDDPGYGGEVENIDIVGLVAELKGLDTNLFHRVNVASPDIQQFLTNLYDFFGPEINSAIECAAEEDAP